MTPKEGPRTYVREFTRVKIQVKALVKTGDLSKRTLYAAETINISGGGACLQIKENKKDILEALSRRTPLFNVSLTLKERVIAIENRIKTTWIESRLKWLLTPSDEDDPVLIGLAFEGIDKTNERKICSFIDDYLASKKESLYRDRIDTILDERKNRQSRKRSSS